MTDKTRKIAKALFVCAAMVALMGVLLVPTPTLGQSCPAGFSWQGGQLCAAYKVTPSFCASHGGRYVNPGIPGAPTRCEVATSTSRPPGGSSGGGSSNVRRPEPSRPSAPQDHDNYTPVPRPTSPENPLAGGPSRAECDAHFSTLRTLDAAHWERIRREYPRRTDQWQRWERHARERDAVSNRCITAFPGAYEAMQAQAWVRAPGSDDPSSRIEKIPVPAECRFAFADVAVEYAQNGDFVMRVVTVDDFRLTIGLNNAMRARDDAWYSESLDAKLRWACEAYLNESTLARRAVRAAMEAARAVLNYVTGYDELTPEEREKRRKPRPPTAGAGPRG